MGRIINSLGTLGGGNHFLELGRSQKDEIWVTIHTGSRNFGKRICDYWQGRAVKFLQQDKMMQLRECIDAVKEEYKYTPRKIKEKIAQIHEELDLNTAVDMKGCEWLEEDMAAGYLYDMIFAQVYAEVNRKYIASIIESLFQKEPLDKVETTHNFIDFRDFIIRKGAIRSYEKERMIIPFNMRDGLLICEGKSNSTWNYSAPHGAGRVLSRTQAKKRLKVEDFEHQMKGIYSTSVGKGTLDEAPDAYKDASIIEAAIEPTAIILDRIKPIHNMKDVGGSPSWRKRKGK